MPCGYNHNGVCQIATKIAGREATIPTNACNVCLKSAKPRQINDTTVSIACYAWSSRGDRQRANEIYRKHVVEFLRPGAGTELHKILAKKGLQIEHNCPCLPTIHRMNNNGPEWCLANINMIAEEMQKEWKRRFADSVIPAWLLRTGARRLIKRAIYRCRNCT